ncbi:MAG: nucleoside recognition domain-containing protein [Gammaproteobacteria bacterium]
MNLVFVFFIVVAFATACWQQLNWQPLDLNTPSPLQSLTENMISTSSDAITLAIGLVGVMCLFLGVMKIAEDSGLVKVIGKLLYPLLVKLFPEVPQGHPAMGAMVMNLSANVLGLGNAATPFGIKAMQGLNQLNPYPGVASNAMILFLAINTSSVTLLPIKVIAIRAAAGSSDAAAIIPTTLFATLCSTLVAIFVAKLLNKWLHPTLKPSEPAVPLEPFPTEKPYSVWICGLAMIGILSLFPLTILYGQTFGHWIIPSLLTALVLYASFKRVKVYEAFTTGAKEGFDVAVKIMPFLVAMLMAIGMFRISGAMDVFIDWVSPFTNAIGLPAEALPMAIMRPLSGSGSLGILAETLNNPAIGPDSYTGYLVSTIMGSTETTFYVLAVYFGAVQVKRYRHALIPALIADFAAVLASVFIVSRVFN